MLKINKVWNLRKIMYLKTHNPSLILTASNLAPKVASLPKPSKPKLRANFTPAREPANRIKTRAIARNFTRSQRAASSKNVYDRQLGALNDPSITRRSRASARPFCPSRANPLCVCRCNFYESLVNRKRIVRYTRVCAAC